jgi:hypothetical protein
MIGVSLESATVLNAHILRGMNYVLEASLILDTVAERAELSTRGLKHSTNDDDSRACGCTSTSFLLECDMQQSYRPTHEVDKGFQINVAASTLAEMRRRVMTSCHCIPSCFSSRN